jgi:hypothetical protein
VVGKSGSYWLAVAVDSPYDPTVAEVDIFKYVGSAFVHQATVPLSADGGAGSISPPSSQGDGAIVSANLTGSSAPDFFVTTDSGSTSVGSVVAFVNGTWQPVPFATSNGPAIAVPAASVTGNQVDSQVNNCIPDCANGSTTDTYYQYVATSSDFETAGGTATSTTTAPPTTVATASCTADALQQAADNSTDVGVPVNITQLSCLGGYAKATLSLVSDPGDGADAYFSSSAGVWTVISVGTDLRDDPALSVIPSDVLQQLDASVP